MTGMTAFNTLSHPRGHVSNAGGFSDKAHSAPETALNVPGSDADLRSALAQIQAHARKYARRYRFSDETREDVVQDTVLDLLAQQKRKGTASINQPALLNSATRAVASRYIDPDAQHIDLTARRLLAKTVELEEEALGRPVTEKERNALAADVRTGAFEPGHRPHDDFHLSRTVFSLDFQVGDKAGETTGSLMSTKTLGNPYATDESELADTVDDLANHRVAVSAVKRDAWNHLAWLTKAPQAGTGTVSKEDAKAARAAMAGTAGGAAALAREWLTSRTTGKQNATLFAAFPGTSILERTNIAAALLRNPEFADALWGSAIGIASRPAAG